MIQASRILQLAQRRKVDPKAVSDYLFALQGTSIDGTLLHFSEYQKAHPEYSPETFSAIQTGLLEHFANEADTSD